MSKAYGATKGESATIEDSATQLPDPPTYRNRAAQHKGPPEPPRRGTPPGRKVMRRRREVRRRAAKVATVLSVLVLVPVVAVVVTRLGSSGGTDTTTTVAHDYGINGHPRRHRHRPPIASPTATPSASPTTAKPKPTTAPPTTTPPSTSTGTAPKGVPTAGVPAGTVLKAMSGTTISKDGTVIDGADIKGGVTITGANVVIKNSRISGSGDSGVNVSSGSLTIQDSTVSGFDNSVVGDNYTATRIEVTKANEDGFKIGSNVTIQNSWCHDLVVSAGAHSDCGQVQSGIRNATIKGNWFDPGNPDANSALFLAPDLGPSAPGPLVVENNVLGGGNYTVQCVDGDNGKYLIADISILNNVFLPNSRYGPLRVNVKAVVSGNTMQDTKKVVSS
jgi:hypothetical protein